MPVSSSSKAMEMLIFISQLHSKKIAPPILHIAANDRYQCIFREYVSRKAADKGRAILEGLGLSPAEIATCYENYPRNVEEAVQAGLIKWSEGGGCTWRVLLEAMVYARIAYHHCKWLLDKILIGPMTGAVICWN